MQAWAQYYAQGGTDLTGSVYFISVPGITDAHTPPVAAGAQPVEGQRQQQQQVATSHSGPGSSPQVVTQGLERSNSLPNPYGPSSPMSTELASPTSAGPGRAPWDATTLPSQFAQMRMGEPSVGA